MQAVLKKNSFTGILSHQRIKERRDFKDPGFLFSAIAVVTVVVMVILFYLWSRLLTVSIGYEISRAERERMEFARETERLKLEVETLKSPSRIEEIAKGELGLIYPRQEQIIKVR